MPHYYL